MLPAATVGRDAEVGAWSALASVPPHVARRVWESPCYRGEGLRRPRLSVLNLSAAAQVGYMLLHDARGAGCGSQEVPRNVCMRCLIVDSNPSVMLQSRCPRRATTIGGQGVLPCPTLPGLKSGRSQNREPVSEGRVEPVYRRAPLVPGGVRPRRAEGVPPGLLSGRGCGPGGRKLFNSMIM